MKTIILQVTAGTQNFWTVNWYYLVAITVSIFSARIAYKNYKKKPQSSLEKESSNFEKNSITNNIPINIVNNVSNIPANNFTDSKYNSIDELKATTKILFIDDNHTDYKIVSILKKAGWIKTKSVKDVTDLDNSSVFESDIIFVDINGVGQTLFEDQGLGLASALKKKYPRKKIVIYSAETSGDRFHQALREVDQCLPKNADAYQFINLIENLLKGNG